MFRPFRRRAACVAIAAACAPAASVHAADVCKLVKRADLERALGHKVQHSESARGIPAEACSYMLAPSGGRMGMFILARITAPVPPGQEGGLLARDGDNDRVVPAPDAGEGGVINVAVGELAVRKKGVLYHMVARGVPCGQEERTDEQRAQCRDRRVGMLKGVAALL